MGNMVTNFYAKSNRDRLCIDKALGPVHTYAALGCAGLRCAVQRCAALSDN